MLYGITCIILDIVEKKFSESVRQWCDTLSEEIEKCIAAGRRIYIIALSRKMPRFFAWLRWIPDNGSISRLLKNLDDPLVELTTEYAIPVIFSNVSDTSSPECVGIVVDDAIIFGATANKVCMEWLAASGTEPKYSTLFRSQKGKLRDIFIGKDIYSSKELSFNDLKAPLREISKCILRSALPVDMEYPIIWTNKYYLEVKDFIANMVPCSWRRYNVESEIDQVTKESFTVMLDGERLNNGNSDFAKVRVFDKGVETALEVLAPCSIAEDDLFKGDFFLEPDYREIWENVLDVVGKVRPSDALKDGPLGALIGRFSAVLEARKRSTLIVWANYLLSLSVFINNMDVLVGSNECVCIKEEDVKLILGAQLAKPITKKLNDLISKRVSVSVNMEHVTLPIYVNPTKLHQNYMTQVAAQMIPAAGIEANLDQIYKVSYFSSQLYDDLPDREDVGHHIIGETYDSLRVHLNRFHHEKESSDVEMVINRWIDQRIDESRISPKYEIVIGSDNRRYFRRFFLCGSNSIA